MLGVIFANNYLDKIRWELLILSLIQKDKPYVHGSHGPDSFDCAGLVWYLYKEILNVKKSRDKYNIYEEGVYLSPNIEEAIKYAYRTCLGWYNIKFKFIIMVRVNPTKIRSPGGYPVDWIVNGNDDEVRPYRLLIKTY